MKQKSVIETIQSQYHKISPRERKVADFILRQPGSVIEYTIKDLANASEVSEATVVRMCQHLGYKGYWPFRTMLARDIGALNEHRKEAKGKDIVADIFQSYADVMHTLGKNVNAETMAKCIELLGECDQAHIIAAGNTGVLAQHMGFRLGRIGIRATYSGVAEYFMNTINLADKGDVLVAISQTGITKTVIKGAELAKEKGLTVIAITAYGSSRLGELADHVLVSKGDSSRFDYYKNYNHLSEMAVIEALLDLLTDRDKIIAKQADVLEILLSDAKL